VEKELDWLVALFQVDVFKSFESDKMATFRRAYDRRAPFFMLLPQKCPDSIWKTATAANWNGKRNSSQRSSFFLLKNDLNKLKKRFFNRFLKIYIFIY